MEEAERFGANGVNGTLEVLPDRIIIRRKRAWLALLGQAPRGRKEIAVDQVAGTGFKNATAFINGYIQSSLIGDVETRRGAFDASQDENAITFTIKQQPGFEKARELIELHREAIRNAAPDSNG
jgi:hypothetical protein